MKGNRRVIFLFLFLPIFLIAQEEKTKSTKDGWAIHIGAGFMFGGNAGVLIENQILLKEKLRISPFMALGIAEGETDSASVRYNWFGSAMGANLEYGKKHRAILGPHLISQSIIGNSVEVKKNFLPGLSFIVGYKGTANFGLIWQVYIGNIYTQDPLLESKKYFNYSHVGVGIGYKF